MHRLLATLLLALAFMLSPLAMLGAGSALAGAPGPHAASSVAHCQEAPEAPAPDKRGLGMERSCAIACAALLPSGACLTDPSDVQAGRPSPGGHRLLSGTMLESETPPPRAAPYL